MGLHLPGCQQSLQFLYRWKVFHFSLPDPTLITEEPRGNHECGAPNRSQALCLTPAILTRTPSRALRGFSMSWRPGCTLHQRISSHTNFGGGARISEFFFSNFSCDSNVQSNLRTGVLNPYRLKCGRQTKRVDVVWELHEHAECHAPPQAE